MPKKELAKGYTTGTCAQAATRAAMQMLFTGEKVEQVSVELPQGEKLQLDITDIQRKYTDGYHEWSTGLQSGKAF